MMDVSQMAQLWLDSQSFGIGGKSQRDYFQQIINEHVEKEAGKNDSGNVSLGEQVRRMRSELEQYEADNYNSQMGE